MTGPYDDMLHLPHHVSDKRPQMAGIDRAAQFSPFAALTGHAAAIRETGRLTDRRIELDEDARAALDSKLNTLMGRDDPHPMLHITYFLADKKKAGGAYVRVTGNLKRVDEYRKRLILMDGTAIPVADIIELEDAASLNSTHP